MMGTKPQFTWEDVLDLLPQFSVNEENDGVRITRSSDLSYDKETMLEPVAAIMRAALTLKLHPDQFEDNSKYSDDRRMGSSWTGEYGSEFIHFDVKFLFRRPV